MISSTGLQILRICIHRLLLYVHFRRRPIISFAYFAREIQLLFPEYTQYGCMLGKYFHESPQYYWKIENIENCCSIFRLGYTSIHFDGLKTFII